MAGRLADWLWVPEPHSSQPDTVAARWADPLNHLLAFAAGTVVIVAALGHSIKVWNWAAVWEYRRLFINGWLMTLLLSAGALLGSALLGAVIAAMARSRLRPARAAARLYVEIVRGTPLLVILLVGYYGLANAAGLEDRYLAGVLLLSLFSGAYISEIFRGGLDAVGEQLRESARAVGFTPWQTFRHVTLPLATRTVLPALTGQFALLVKDSSLLSVISVAEITMNAQQVASRTFGTMEAYLPLAAAYLLITLPISFIARRLEKVLHYES